MKWTEAILLSMCLVLGIAAADAWVRVYDFDDAIQAARMRIYDLERKTHIKPAVCPPAACQCPVQRPAKHVTYIRTGISPAYVAEVVKACERGDLRRILDLRDNKE